MNTWMSYLVVKANENVKLKNNSTYRLPQNAHIWLIAIYNIKKMMFLFHQMPMSTYVGELMLSGNEKVNKK